jgi:hypothetical protein
LAKNILEIGENLKIMNLVKSAIIKLVIPKINNEYCLDFVVMSLQKEKELE